MFERVTDPDILKQLNQELEPIYEKVIDPTILSQLDKEEKKEEFGKLIGLKTTPISNILDFLKGGVKGVSNIVQMVPGLKHPQDVESIFGKTVSPQSEMLGKYLLPTVAGGPSMPGQILANLLYGYTQGKPGEKVLGGLLPEGRFGSALEAGGMAGIPFGAGLLLKTLIGAGKLPFQALKNVAPLQEEVTSAEEGILRAQQAKEQAEKLAQSETGLSDIGKMEHAKKEKEKRLSELPIQAEVSTLEDEMSKFLNKGISHDERVAEKVKLVQEKNRENISSKYDKIEENLQDKNIILKNPGDAKQISQDLFNLIKIGQSETPEALRLLNELESVGKNEIIPANDYLRMYRSVRQYAREARTKAYQPGMNSEERAMWQKRYNELDEKANEMGEVLENGIGKENAEKLKVANKEWREKVVPMYKNTIYQNILKHTRMPENIMKSLRGTEPGNVIIRDIIKSDPEIVKNVIGQRYAQNPHKLHNIGELEQEYIEKVPELKKLLSRHKTLTSNYPGIKSGAKTESYINEANKLMMEIDKLDKNIPELQKYSERKDLSIDEHIKSKKRYDEAIKKRSNARKKLAIIGGLIGGTKLIKGISTFSGLGED